MLGISNLEFICRKCEFTCQEKCHILRIKKENLAMPINLFLSNAKLSGVFA